MADFYELYMPTELPFSSFAFIYISGGESTMARFYIYIPDQLA